MSESLATLLLRLSEAGEPAFLWGRRAKPYLDRAFDRLLADGVVVEQAPATSWPVCATCDCGLYARPIEEIDGRSIAICPNDARSDVVLDADDLRSFHIDQGRLIREMALASGFEAEPSDVVPGVWLLGPASRGRVAFAACTLTAARQPSLLAILRAAARGAPVTLLGPALPHGDRRRFDEAGVHLVPLREAIRTHGGSAFSLDVSRLVPEPGIAPRLVIVESMRQVTLDGVERALSEQPFRLLCLLATQARTDGATVQIRDIEAHIWGAAIHRLVRQARDVVRELRDGLSKGSADPKPIRALIGNRRNPNGYRLALAPEDIDLRP